MTGNVVSDGIARPVKNGPIKVLVMVEDNPGDGRLLQEMSNEPAFCDFEFVQAQSIGGAEMHLATCTVDVILLDLCMPDVQGFSALQRIIAAAPHVPLIVVTGLDDSALAIQTLKEGAQDYFIKGEISTRGLLRALHHALERKTMQVMLLEEKGHAVAINRALLLGCQRQLQFTEISQKFNAELQTEIAVSEQAQQKLIQKELRIEAALREKDVLLREIHHRVKNNLQIVNSLLELQCAQIQDSSALLLLRDTQNRIRSMALIHQTLYQSNDFSKVDFGLFLNSLAPILIASYQKDPEHIVLSIRSEDIQLSIDAAIPCGLLVNELLSNCLKHAFPRETRGRIDVSFIREADHCVVLSVSDNGVGIADDFDLTQTESLGLQLVFLLANQLRGEVTIRRSDPTAFALRFCTRDA